MACRKGCKKLDFVKYGEPFNYHWPSFVHEHWPKTGTFKCRTCGEKIILTIKPPKWTQPASEGLYVDVNKAMASNGLPEYSTLLRR